MTLAIKSSIKQLKSLVGDKEVSEQELRQARQNCIYFKLCDRLGLSFDRFMAQNGLGFRCTGLPIEHFLVFSKDVSSECQELGVKCFYYDRKYKGHQHRFWAIPFNRVVCSNAGYDSGLKNVFAYEFLR